MKTHSVRGFTLVELAIVMTIIGLLIGGILKGQELLENARVTATIAQIKGYSAALITFRDIYSATPGDMSNALMRIPGCTANCNAAIVGGIDGRANDGMVGRLSSSNFNQLMGFYITSQAAPLPSPPASIADETQLFWVHLLQANLITGITAESFAGGVTPKWGVTHPAAKIGGGFIVSESPLFGLIAFTASIPTAQYSSSGRTFAGTGTGVMTPVRAQQIDSKMDDGKPLNGEIVAAISGEDCFIYDTPTGQRIYNGTITSKACAIGIRLQ